MRPPTASTIWGHAAPCPQRALKIETGGHVAQTAPTCRDAHSPERKALPGFLRLGGSASRRSGGFALDNDRARLGVDQLRHGIARIAARWQGRLASRGAKVLEDDAKRRHGDDERSPDRQGQEGAEI